MYNTADINTLTYWWILRSYKIKTGGQITHITEHLVYANVNLRFFVSPLEIVLKSFNATNRTQSFY